ncbi:MAG: HAMP domain-containing sensor histidine kinase [Candidatus Buchananbacteria bacterium]
MKTASSKKDLRRKKNECLNLDCWLVKNLNYSPYKRCKHCRFKFRECLFLHYQIVSAVMILVFLALFYFVEGHISTLAVVMIFSFVIVYGFFFNRSTESIVEANFAQAQSNDALEELTKSLEQRVKKATAKLEATNKELQRLDDAKSEFLSIASHQLRTPTTIIKGYVSMMQEGNFGKVPKILKDNLDKVFIATERLLNLIENLLDISRIEAGRLEFDIKPADLAKIADELKEEFKAKATAKGLKLNVYYSKDLPDVSTDSAKIKEVASNLVDNAVKYTKAGEISLDLHQEGSSVVFSVADTGSGITAGDVGRLFNKFVRGQGMSTIHPEGTGLGLYFARVVIENLGGRIWAESPGKGRGSKFSFSLPLVDKSKAQKVKK